MDTPRYSPEAQRVCSAQGGDKQVCHKGRPGAILTRYRAFPVSLAVAPPISASGTAPIMPPPIPARWPHKLVAKGPPRGQEPIGAEAEGGALAGMDPLALPEQGPQRPQAGAGQFTVPQQAAQLHQGVLAR